MTTLVLAEHNGQQIHNEVRHAVSAAQHWGQPVHLLVVGYQSEQIANQAAAIDGVSLVLHTDAQQFAHPLAEDVSKLIDTLVADYQVILAAHSSFSRNVLPRVAALADVAMISDVLEIQTDNRYVRAIYAGNVHTTIQSRDAKQILTVRGSKFSAADLNGQAEITDITAPEAFTKTRWLSESRIETDRPALNSAKVVVSGGRSLGSAEKFDALLNPLAEKLGAALGATRAAVDAGYAPNEIQVGQTGVTVAPELYFAVGVSGAVQHTAGMKDSRIVVAINQDPDAPIFQVADYGLVADLFDAVPTLTNALS
ncbi:electron transfer flavoprotein subunit alpha/FixB family protein [Methylophaga sulfidovorans]|uniref:Electron transfer flavoprotein subunit alpha n=1 Tax=Methylophaga sulfidovorans TaxID=45496 RepID=A0A1I3WI70_9GAMM|nr:FAD-binding protein [Methylophaga sulfidovorans]SFK06899.1 electron transfer flavoprotein alpha subunit apoprotein [Methylophaga sulfidovorans]